MWRGALLSVSLVGVVGCGPTGDELATDLSTHLTPNAPASDAPAGAGLTKWYPILTSPAYTGQLAVMFAEGTEVRLVDGQLTSLAGHDLRGVAAALAAVPGVVVARGIPPVTDAEIQNARAVAKARGGSLADWANFYQVTVPDPVAADQLLFALWGEPAIWFAHPDVRGTPMGPVTPDYSGSQGYLAADNGGLNVVAAWDAGLTGAGVQVVDVEFFWNFAHEDLAIAPQDLVFQVAPLSGYSPSDASANHGTAVVGVVAGQDNGSGVRGIASGATIKVAQTDQVMSDTYTLVAQVVAYLNGQNGFAMLKPGTVFVQTVGYPAPASEPCNMGADATAPMVSGSGCGVPAETYGSTFLSFQSAVSSGGVTIVEAAGNGAFDLSGAVFQGGEDPWTPDLSTEHSGAIMVGASTGPAMTKLPMSNCGARVDLYAWGQGVVTTGYGDLAGDPADPATANQWYTAQFGGTSAATAQIAGVVALLQEYARKLAAPSLKPWEAVYLPAAEVLKLLKQAGAGREAKETNGCPIGVQPDVGVALQLLNDGVIQPTKYNLDNGVVWVNCQIGGWCAEWCEQFPPDQLPDWCGAYLGVDKHQGALAVPMDLDGDARADLVAFGRDRKWYVDLSSSGANPDHYGTWDLILTPSPLGLSAGSVAEGEGALSNALLFPVVGDYNTDGRADLALYESITGQWLIRYTDAQILGGQWGAGWSKVIDYSQAPGWQPYSRPVPGDYDGADANDLTFDRWLDPALVTPGGYWLIDEIEEAEGKTTGQVAGTFDKGSDSPFLLPEQLDWAPGWAYLPVPLFSSNTNTHSRAYAVPPPVPDPPWNALPAGVGYLPAEFWSKEWYDVNPASIVVAGEISHEAKEPGGTWNTMDGEDGSWNLPYNFGGTNCRPIVADFDGDTVPDRAVACPHEWRIAYSGNQFPVGPDGLRHIAPTGGMPQDPLPGTVYPGGVAYADIQKIYQSYNFGCPKEQSCTIFNLTPPPTGPYFPICLKYWPKSPLECLNY